MPHPDDWPADPPPNTDGAEIGEPDYDINQSASPIVLSEDT